MKRDKAGEYDPAASRCLNEGLARTVDNDESAFDTTRRVACPIFSLRDLIVTTRTRIGV